MLCPWFRPAVLLPLCCRVGSACAGKSYARFLGFVSVVVFWTPVAPRQVAGSFLCRVRVKHLVLNVRIVSQELAKPCVYRVICCSTERVVSCELRKYKKMVFPVVIRQKSHRGVALSCDAHVMFASSGKIRQPCTFSLSDPVSCEIFFFKSAFLRGKLIYIHVYIHPLD